MCAAWSVGAGAGDRAAGVVGIEHSEPEGALAQAVSGEYRRAVPFLVEVDRHEVLVPRRVETRTALIRAEDVVDVAVVGVIGAVGLTLHDVGAPVRRWRELVARRPKEDAAQDDASNGRVGLTR